MIGVVAAAPNDPFIREFFELFKTPWEFYRRDRCYDVLLCCGAEVPEERPKLTVIYAGRRIPFDAQHRLETFSGGNETRLGSLNGTTIPLYGESVVFRAGRCPAMLVRRCEGKVVVRFGYDLFGEALTLLTAGQPVAHAAIPTLDLHIRALRDVIVAGCVRLVEIPPVPGGYRFIACLTHDVDHPLLRTHKADRTMCGFLYRATAGSLLRVLRGRLSVRGLLRNWAAVVKLPLVHLGLAQDFWREFDRYPELEQGARSTFFVIPFKDRPGRNAPVFRASRYGPADIADQMRALVSERCEIGLHGIDAWHDSYEARAEAGEIRRITGQREIGVRMHWLYYSPESPGTLERAGIDYDSTIGYNETVGYRAGTTQVYRPLQASRLLELPLHVMDTALFYPCHLDLSPREAWERVSGMIGHAVELGGCLTVNWHDRSIAPERLWGEFYLQLVGALRQRGAWFATASETVAWFRKRRSAEFETARNSSEVHLKTAPGAEEEMPGLQLRIHSEPEPRQRIEALAAV